MTRAAKICPEPRCPNLVPCPLHTKEPWAGSTRSTRTVSGSRQQKRARWVMAKHSGICHVCGQPGADQVDHVIPLSQDGPDEVANLRPIHSDPCHKEKTSAESLAARTAPNG